MTKAFAILASALLGAALVGGTVYAQTSSSDSKCGPEVYSQATQTYVGVPCNSGTESAASTPCKPEGYSTSDQTYSAVPCPAGTTYENPGWKGPKPQ